MGFYSSYNKWTVMLYMYLHATCRCAAELRMAPNLLLASHL